MSKIKGSKKEGVHTTIDRRTYNDMLLPFSNQKNVGFNIVFETLLEIAYELCRQNNIEISSNSLFEIKKRVSRGSYQFINPIIVQTDDNGKTIISIPKEHSGIAEEVIKSIQGKAVSGELLITREEKNEPKKKNEDEADCELPYLRERVAKYLRDCGGEALRSDVKKHFHLSRQSMSNVSKELRLGGKIETRKNTGTIKLTESA